MQTEPPVPAPDPVDIEPVATPDAVETEPAVPAPVPKVVQEDEIPVNETKPNPDEDRNASEDDTKTFDTALSFDRDAYLKQMLFSTQFFRGHKTPHLARRKNKAPQVALKTPPAIWMKGVFI